MNQPSRESVIQVERARVQFGKLVAVDEVSFRLHPGTLLGLVGPNGAGKTTLLRAIAGLQPLSGGSVHVLGSLLRPGMGHVLQHVGFTPDNPPVYEELTVRTFLTFIAKGYHLDGPELDERIDFWLEKVWLKEKADQKIKSLSRGMRQRIGIARTLLPNPSVILLDEPAAGLDPAGRVQFRRLLCELRDQGKVLIVSSHILSDLAEYCTHIGIMAHGQMKEFGTVAQIAGGGADEKCRYTILLARPLPGLEKMLGEIPGVEQIQVDRDQVVLTFSNQRHDAALLLRELIQREIPVASFTANTHDLEEAYLRAGIGQVD